MILSVNENGRKYISSDRLIARLDGGRERRNQNRAYKKRNKKDQWEKKTLEGEEEIKAENNNRIT